MEWHDGVPSQRRIAAMIQHSGQPPPSTPFTCGLITALRVQDAAGDDALGIGDVGPDVAALQRALQRSGFPSIVEDGDFGRRTANAVEQVQAMHRLPVTGRVGARTAIALGLA